MKRNRILVSVAVLLLLLSGCTRYYPTYSLKDADLYGIYKTEILSEDSSSSMSKQELTLLEDGTYKYFVCENDYETKEECIHGDINKIEPINNDIVKIELSNFKLENNYYLMANPFGASFYIYKNLLGRYIQMDTEQIKSNSEFVIQYDDIAKISFGEDGRFKSSGLPDDEQYYFNYKVKSNIIWADWQHNNKYSTCFYIVDGGVFEPITIKSS